ncbi:hypothetical protein R3P38DRAFT_2959223 [Favolaschia claudopus]|uniref:Uncharacterized protein n=1 Tax=Favolaschia claudopus TaxID=2862362 RepID=A0AAW0BBA8_9AGAR
MRSLPSLPTMLTTPPSTPARLLLHLATELLLIFTAASLLTSFLLPIFGLHATMLTVLRVTGLFTAVVFAVSEVLATILGGHEEKETETVGNEKSEIMPASRRLRDRESGWPCETRSVG